MNGRKRKKKKEKKKRNLKHEMQKNDDRKGRCKRKMHGRNFF